MSRIGDRETGADQEQKERREELMGRGREGWNSDGAESGPQYEAGPRGNWVRAQNSARERDAALRR